ETAPHLGELRGGDPAIPAAARPSFMADGPDAHDRVGYVPAKTYHGGRDYSGKQAAEFVAGDELQPGGDQPDVRPHVEDHASRWIPLRLGQRNRCDSAA